ncbi:hypothetical protein [Escherichia coli]|uniref:hypothetical protein n=1 Tax=Escherichia coli TaxID=562 RepID=UPI002FCCBFB8
MNLLTPVELTGEAFGRASDAGASFGRIVATAINWILTPTEIMLGLLSKVWQACSLFCRGIRISGTAWILLTLWIH